MIAEKLPSRSGYVRADAAAMERLLNVYLRERGITDPRVDEARILATRPPLVVQAELLAAGSTPIRVELPRTRQLLLGTLRRHSPSGHHAYGPRLWHMAASGRGGGLVENALHLAHLLVAELVAGEPDATAHRVGTLIGHIRDSIERTALYLDRYAGPRALSPDSPGAFVAAEQRILFGHPFHPTPKSSEGFTPEDLDRYAPELGARFRLHYLAAAPELVTEDFLPGMEEAVLPEAVRGEARARLGAQRRGWRLLPCHPWQAAHLQRTPGFHRLVADGRVVLLGAVGEVAHPTSSVRTVLPSGHAWFFKLPLGVRVTNLIRENPREEIQRSMDVGRVVAGLRLDIAEPALTLLGEVGYRAISPPDRAPDERLALERATAVMFRDARPCLGRPAPLVVAALLEPHPDGGEPELARVVRRATGPAVGQLPAAGVESWLERYLGISMLPLLRLFVHHGLSLEAHVQNSLLVLEDGWPSRLIVRDFEGASLRRTHAERLGLYGGRIAEGSPALYSDAEAWDRLAYYFFTNHLGHLLATLSSNGPSEARLWATVRRVLELRAEELRAAGGGPYLERLLDGPTLPAKANLISRLRERGERPLYLTFPNPIRNEVSSWS